MDDQVQEQSRWVDLGGPTHYQEWTAGGSAPHGGPPPVVLVHGLSGSFANWAAMAPALAAAGHRVLALDLPGHGLTRPGLRDAGVGGLAVVLRRFIAEVAGRPVVLVGNSLGGLLALQQAARTPDSVAALVLMAPVVPIGRSRLHPVTLAGFAGYALPGVGELVVGARRRSPAQKSVEISLRWCCGDADRVPADLVERHVQLVLQRAGYRRLEGAFLASARTLLRQLSRPGRMRRTMDAVQAPVLLVQGDLDRLVPVASVRRVARAHPDWRYVELAGVGHVPMMEVPQQVSEVLREWLAEVEVVRLAGSVG